MNILNDHPLHINVGGLRVRVTLGLCVVMAVLACMVYSPVEPAGASTAKAQMTDITIGDGISNSLMLPIWVAIDNGYFAKQNINVTLASLTDTTLTPAIVSGSVNYAQENVSLFLSSLGQNLPLVAIQDATGGVPVALIVSTQFAQTKGITSKTPLATVMKDLVGSTAGFSSPVTQGQANILLNSFNINASQVTETTFASISGLEAAFSQNSVNWFVTGQPTPATLQAAGSGIVVATSKNAPAWNKPTLINNIIVATKSYVSSHKALTKRVLTALHLATQFIIKNPSRAAAVVQENLPGTSPAIGLVAVAANVWPVTGLFTPSQWSGSISFAEAATEVPSGTTIAKSNYTNVYATEALVPSITHVVGAAVPGKRSIIRIVGSDLYGQPKVTSNAPGTKVRVDTGTGSISLSLFVTSAAGTLKGSHTLTLKFSAGQVVRAKYQAR